MPELVDAMRPHWSELELRAQIYKRLTNLCFYSGRAGAICPWLLVSPDRACT